MTAGEYLLIALAGFGAGVVNGVAGGGSLLSFPALLAVGYPSVVANVTSTVGIWPGYLGGAAGFRIELVAQRDRVRALTPVALAGGVSGAALLLVTPSDVFRAIAPYLILAACALFATQPVLARKVAARRQAAADQGAVGVRTRTIPRPALAGVYLASVYGGYFGAGLGVILLAVLGLVLDDSLTRINGLRGALSLLINSIAAMTFIVAADIAWGAAGVLALTSLVGGYAGARASRRLPAPVLRAVVVAIGLVAALRLFTS